MKKNFLTAIERAFRSISMMKVRGPTASVYMYIALPSICVCVFARKIASNFPECVSGARAQKVLRG